MQNNVTTRYLVATLALSMACSLVSAQETGLGRNKRMFAVPVPAGKPVVIDGKLDEWDLSGAIDMYVMKATADMQGTRFAVMYDAEALYLGAEVRDPTPLLNRQSPEANAQKGWNGDSCQFRIVTDPTAGYPVNFNTYQNVETADRGSGRVAHLTLWHYTDRQEPVLQAQLGMDYTPASAANQDAIVPRDRYQAAYRKTDDGRGYAFEYRIPWATLEAKRVPVGGDMAAATVQFNFSDATGLSTAGNSAWCYDLMSGPGFPFQNTFVWGKLIFSKTGHLPRELVEQGLPPVKDLPLSFAYDLPEDGEVTIALFDAANTVVRTVVASSPRPAGRQNERWDGCDEAGKPLPAGAYRWKGLYHQPLKTEHVLSVHNSGTPPWQTDDGKGSWGGDHGPPTCVCVAGDRVYLGWISPEAGNGIVATDLEGRKQWGTKSAGPMYMATDGKNLFTYSASGFDLEVAIKILSAKDGALAALQGKVGRLVPPGENAPVTGLACDGAHLYAAYGSRNLIVAYDAVTGAMKATLDVPKPSALAVAKDGGLLAVSVTGDKSSVITDHRSLITDHLDSPAGMAVDGDGLIYVSNGGKLQNVSVFGPDGKYLRSIGKAGGRPRVGRYEAGGMLAPFGLAVAPDGRLWVAECSDSPKRISVWDSKGGTLVKEFFGGAHYSAAIWMDPERPDEVYCDGVLWRVDLDKKTSRPFSTVWRQLDPNMPGGFSTHVGGPRIFTARNGKQYAYGLDAGHSMVLCLREDDRWRPLLAFIYKPSYPAIAGDNWPGKPPHGGTFPWVDANGDMTIHVGELGPELGPSWYRGFSYVDSDLNLYHGGYGQVFRPVRIQADGRPVYDWSKPEETAKAVIDRDPADGSLHLFNENNIGLGFGRLQPDGKPLWRVGGLISWREALGLPPQRPGKLWGPTQYLGLAGDYTGLATYFGCHHLYTRDGLCVGMVFVDTRVSTKPGPEHIMCENYNGQLVKPKGMNRYFALGGDVDGRVTEIFGLDTVKRLPGGNYELTPAQVELAAQAIKDYEAKLAGGQTLTIVRGKPNIEQASAVEKSTDLKRSFRYQAAHDDKNLYLLADVNSPSPLVNAIADDRLVFKGGNLLDIQIAADPAADPKREKPAAGDVRILASVRENKPFVVVFRPVVKGFTGEKIVLNSPTGSESFDVIERTERIGIEYKPKQGVQGFTALVTIPLDLIGLTPKAGGKVRMDLGYIFGSSTGNQATLRSYWSNNGFSANVLNDVPNESRLTPAEWGEAEME